MLGPQAETGQDLGPDAASPQLFPHALVMGSGPLTLPGRAGSGLGKRLSGQLCATGGKPKSGRESKKHLAPPHALQFVASCQMIVNLRQWDGSLEKGSEELALGDPTSQRCRESFALNHAVSEKLCFVFINSCYSDPLKPGQVGGCPRWREGRRGLGVCCLECLCGGTRS